MKYALTAFLLTATNALADAPIIEATTATRTGDTWRFEVTIRHPDTGWDHLSYDFSWLPRQKGATARHAIYGGQWRGSDRGKPGAAAPRRSVIAPVFSSVLNG